MRRDPSPPQLLEGQVWSIEGLRHGVLQQFYGEHAVVWGSVCGVYETAVTRENNGKPPRLFNGFVTCLQCLARVPEDP